MSREFRYSEVEETAKTESVSRCSEVSSVREIDTVPSEVSAYEVDVRGSEVSSELEAMFAEPVTGQEVAEQAHLETKEHMLEQHGHCMTEEQKEYLESSETAEHVTVMESGEYVDRFPEVPFSVLGHCDSNGEIYMKDLDKHIVEHVSTHETMHLCANRENRVERDGTQVIRSGLRETRISSFGEVDDRNLAANEGTTELYTMRELQERGETEAANAISAYSESRMWMQRVESIVGKETLEEAYFGDGGNGLEAQFNYFNEDPHAWREFSKNLDILERSDNKLEVAGAKAKLAKQYAQMYANRYCR